MKVVGLYSCLFAVCGFGLLLLEVMGMVDSVVVGVCKPCESREGCNFVCNFALEIKRTTAYAKNTS